MTNKSIANSQFVSKGVERGQSPHRQANNNSPALTRSGPSAKDKPCKIGFKLPFKKKSLPQEVEIVEGKDSHDSVASSESSRCATPTSYKHTSSYADDDESEYTSAGTTDLHLVNPNPSSNSSNSTYGPQSSPSPVSSNITEETPAQPQAIADLRSRFSESTIGGDSDSDSGDSSSSGSYIAVTRNGMAPQQNGDGMDVDLSSLNNSSPGASGTATPTTNITTPSVSSENNSLHKTLSKNSTPLASGTQTPTNTITATATPEVAPIKRQHGKLSVKLVEATDLGVTMDMLPKAVVQALNANSGGGPLGKVLRTAKKNKKPENLWYLPYAVVSFDKNEVIVEAYGGDLGNPIYCFEAQFDVSRTAEVVISIYVRAAPPGAGCSAHNVGHDLHLSTVMVSPVFQTDVSCDSWFPAVIGQGQFHMHLGFRTEEHPHLTMDHFDLLKVLGKGSYGKVFQVRKKDTGRVYAMKVLKKAHIAAKHEVLHTLTERTILAQVNNPFIVHLKYSFQTTEKLYLVMPYINGGELFHHLRKAHQFDEKRAKFYAAELVCAIEHLHYLGVVYRDLKPENILLTMEGHVMLCDFGLCKLDMYDDERTNTFCGTPDYVSCEVLIGKGYTNAVDWWTLGILIFEMLCGWVPFYHEDKETMYRLILNSPIRFPENFGQSARTIISGLLTRDPKKRLGAGPTGAKEIKEASWFRGVDWHKMAQRKVKPPWKPVVMDPVDVSNIDEEFLAETPMDSVPADSGLSETFQRQFEGFSYEDPSSF